MTSTHDVSGYRAFLRAWRCSKLFLKAWDATPAQTYFGSPVKLEKYGNVGSCGQLWEESEMVWQRKIGAGI